MSVNAVNIQILLKNLDAIDKEIRRDPSRAFSEDTKGFGWKEKKIWAIFASLERELRQDNHLPGMIDRHILSAKEQMVSRLAYIIMYAEIYTD